VSPVVLIVEYLGAAFHGWQRQEGLPTVQAVLEDAVARLLGCAVPLRTSSRTDAGVHGEAHPAMLMPPRDLPLAAYLRGLGSLLPAELSVLQVARAREGFDVRRDALGKTYRYRIWNGRERRPLEAGRAWHVPQRLDEARMEDAASHLLGEHDLSSFRAVHCDSVSVYRNVERITVRREGELLELRIRANAFLRNMARIIVGTLVEVGRGARPPEWIPEVLEARDRTRAGRTAPAHGLYLHRVHYPEGCFAELLPVAGPLGDAAVPDGFRKTGTGASLHDPLPGVGGGDDA